MSSNSIFSINHDLENGNYKRSRGSDNFQPTSITEDQTDIEDEKGLNFLQVKTSFHKKQPVVHIGDQVVYRNEFISAFGGNLNPGSHLPSIHKFANPAPLGVSAFAVTNLVSSLCTVQARHVTTPNIVVGLAFFYGGSIQLLAGMWEMAVQNTFGATSLASYGGYWIAYGAIQTDAFGIISSYGDDIDQLNSALGFFNIAWFIFTTMMVLCTLKSTVAFCALYVFLDLTYLLLACGNFTGHIGVTKAAGVVGCITAVIAFYNAYAGISTKENSYFQIKPIYLPGADRGLYAEEDDIKTL